MTMNMDIQQKFEQLESDTVSDSFGAESLGGRAPVFVFKPIMKWIETNTSNLDEPLYSDLNTLKNSINGQGFKYTMECLGRFSLCNTVDSFTPRQHRSPPSAHKLERLFGFLCSNLTRQKVESSNAG